VKYFFLEGEIFSVPRVVRWYVVRPADGALQWFDMERAQDMFCSTLATKMLSRLQAKVAQEALLPSVTEPRTYRITLENGVVVAGYLIKSETR
jgi:hypothetical protein